MLSSIHILKWLKNIKQHSTTCIIIINDCKQTIIAENHLRFQGHTPVCPGAV